MPDITARRSRPIRLGGPQPPLQVRSEARANVVVTLGPPVAQRAEHNDGRQGANGERLEGAPAGPPRAGEVVFDAQQPSSISRKTDTHEPSTTRTTRA